MGAREHPLELGLADPFLKLVVEFPHLGEGRFVLRLAPQLDEDLDVLPLPVEPVPSGNGLLHGGPFLEDPLGSFLVVPETGDCDSCLQFLDILPLPIYVKETPEAWQYALQVLLRGLL